MTISTVRWDKKKSLLPYRSPYDNSNWIVKSNRLVATIQVNYYNAARAQIFPTFVSIPASEPLSDDVHSR